MGAADDFLRAVAAKPGAGGGGRFEQAYAARQQQAAVAAATPHKAPSLWRQITGVVTGLPAGLMHLGTGLAHDAVSIPWNIGKQVARGNLAGAGDIATLGLLSKGAKQDGWEGSNRIGHELLSSFHQTAMDLRHPTHFARAAREGRIVPLLINDVGNLAIVGGAAAKALGTTGAIAGGASGSGLAGALEARAPMLAEGLARTGEVIGKAARLGAEAANAPISVPRELLTRARFGSPKLAAGELGGLEGLLSRSEIGKSLLTSHPTLLRREGWDALNLGQRAGERMASLASRKLTRDLQRAAELTPDFEAVAGTPAPTPKARWADTPAVLSPWWLEPLRAGQRRLYRFAGEGGMFDGTGAVGHYAENPNITYGTDLYYLDLTPAEASMLDARGNGTYTTMPFASDSAELAALKQGMAERAVRAPWAADVKATTTAAPGPALPTPGFGWTADLARGAAKITKQYGGTPLTEAEQGAIIGLRTGTADALINAHASNPNVPLDRLREYAFYEQKPGHHLTADAMEVARKFRTGELSPVEAARIQFGLDALDKAIGSQTTKRLLGHGTSILDPEHVKLEPIPMSDPAVIDKLVNGGVLTDAEGVHLKKLHAQDPELVRDFFRNDPRFEVYGSTVYETLRDPSIYASPWRPVMTQMQDVNRQLAVNPRDVNAPITPAMLHEAGIAPEYAPSGPFELAGDSKLMRRTAPGDDALKGTSGVRGEQTREGASVAPYTFRGVGGMLGWEARQMEMNVAYRNVVDKGARFDQAWMDPNPTKDGILPAAELKRIYDHAQATADQNVGRFHPDHATAWQREFHQAYGNEMIRTMADAGFEPWPLKGDMTAPVKGAEIDGATPWLRRGLKDKLAPYWRPAPERVNAAWKALRWTNQQWKGIVLPFSLRWQIGDAVSNALMAWTGGGMNPVEMIQRIRQVKQFLATEEGRRLLDAVPNERGLLMEERSWVYDSQHTPKEPRTLIGKAAHGTFGRVKNASFQLNEVINRFERDAVFVGQLERQLADLQAKGIISGSSINAKGVPLRSSALGTNVADRLPDLADASVYDHPELLHAIESAVDRTNKLLGDMANMTPVERYYIRELIPFWAWQRHLYQLAGHLALDHPGRMLMTARIGTMVANDPDLPPFLQGAVKTPFGYLSLNFVNPLADVAGGLPGTSTESTLKSLSPLLKIGAAATLGQDWNRGGSWLSRAPGTGRVDEYGRPTLNPMLLDPSGLLYQVIKQVPQARNVLNLLPQGHRIPGTRIDTGSVVRYGTGDTVKGLRGRPFQTGDNPFLTMLANIGVPRPEPYDKVKQQQATKARRDRIRAAANR